MGKFDDALNFVNTPGFWPKDGSHDVIETIREALTLAQQAEAKKCEVCENQAERGYVETDNNGPIVPCRGCNAEARQGGDVGALEKLHSDTRLVTGNYDYQCGFLDCLKEAKAALAAQGQEWFFRWAARAMADGKYEEAIKTIFHHPANPYHTNNPWDTAPPAVKEKKDGI